MTKREALHTYRIEWSPRSRGDLEAIRAYVEQHAPLAALRLAAALVETAESLAAHPHRGRTVYGPVRELVVVRPYLIRYRITPDAVQIMRIKHGARR
ncbi:MAG: type II toxin-antitoxin system RelE/ParE family toxin [Alphaproteobacteria bacterium]|nr:type II toxin-antitoxin system RelE/ParE family toxin [Alphaproteobacteria bacterium]MBU1514034.1 type II toxin-antitoxin system RelE/ParE family toxin [Alphaproteobacteria bacterium]MBU2093026.1 type II toxin-antitoxin system RelE/ParE family toxin [Alphaproteobacteria bacterium]MBU2151771.1 type II toxin-antitoxin system RelE/ParE family toxin [Alphaproteobacteria bacterium]MBU2309409.1 type II toxin-antitoxin system RelE/ParE family toxin [Alphaproteobacteria bacterium]